MHSVVSKMTQNPAPALGVFSEALAAMMKEIVAEAVQAAISRNGHAGKPPPESRHYFTIKEAALFSRLGESTIRLYIRKRELRACQVGSRVIIKRTDLEKFIEFHPIEVLPD